jgi:hypothetical protein
MLAATCSIRFFSLALVKFLSLVFTALNLLPSIAATAWAQMTGNLARSGDGSCPIYATDKVRLWHECEVPTGSGNVGCWG